MLAAIWLEYIILEVISSYVTAQYALRVMYSSRVINYDFSVWYKSMAIFMFKIKAERVICAWPCLTLTNCICVLLIAIVRSTYKGESGPYVHITYKITSLRVVWDHTRFLHWNTQIRQVLNWSRILPSKMSSEKIMNSLSLDFPSMLSQKFLLAAQEWSFE